MPLGASKIVTTAIRTNNESRIRDRPPRGICRWVENRDQDAITTLRMMPATVTISRDLACEVQKRVSRTLPIVYKAKHS